MDNENNDYLWKWIVFMAIGIILLVILYYSL